MGICQQAALLQENMRALRLRPPRQQRRRGVGLLASPFDAEQRIGIGAQGLLIDTDDGRGP